MTPSTAAIVCSSPVILVSTHDRVEASLTKEEPTVCTALRHTSYSAVASG